MNTAVTVFFLILRVFSLYFLAVSLFGLCSRRRPEPAARLRRFAVLIAARNEESCIAGLIESLRAQHYPPELVDIWVLPNNCTDRTAEAARRAGAQVLEMPASVRSKGAALHTAAKALLRSARNYDAFCVFDADNEADPAFLSEMNRALDRTAIVKSRILAKNRTQAGISACYEIYFCSANHFLNRAREAVGLSARVIGTGFAIRRDLLEALDGFPCRTLTEDAELYAACLCRGARIGYCETAVTYDEEPVTWRASLVQRRRWMSGILQVARLTLPELLTNFLRQPSLNCLDGLLQLSFPFLQALTPFFALEALLAGSMSMQGLPVSLLTAYAGCLAAAVWPRLSPRWHWNGGWIGSWLAGCSSTLFSWPASCRCRRWLCSKRRPSGMRSGIPAYGLPRRSICAGEKSPEAAIIPARRSRGIRTAARIACRPAAVWSAGPHGPAAAAALPCSAYGG